MGQPITWRNVEAPDLSRTIEGMSRISQQGADALSRIGGVFLGIQKDQKDKFNAAKAAELLMAQDTGALDGMRQNVFASGDWRADPVVLAKVFNDQYGALQDRGIKREQILDSEALRTEAPEASRRALIAQQTGQPMDLTGLRSAFNYVDDAQKAQDDYGDNLMRDKTFEESQKNAAFTRAMQVKEFSANQAERAAARRERQLDREERKAPDRAYQAGYALSDQLRGQNVATLEEQQRAGSNYIREHNLDPVSARSLMQGISERHGATTGIGVIADSNNPEALGLLGRLTASNRYNKADLQGKRDNPTTDDNNLSLAAYSPEYLAMSPDEAAKKYFGGSERFVSEVLPFARKYPKIPIGVLVTAASLNVIEDGWISDGINDSAMEKTIRKIAVDFEKGAPARAAMARDSFDSKIGSEDRIMGDLIAQMSADLANTGKIRPETKAAVDKYAAGFEQYSQKATVEAQRRADQEKRDRDQARIRATLPTHR